VNVARTVTAAALFASAVTTLPSSAAPLVDGGTFASFYPVGDLDRDGVGDFVDHVVSGDVGVEESLDQPGLTAYSGRTGQSLWRAAPATGSVTRAVPIRLDTGDGVLVVGDDDVGTVGSAGSTLVGGTVLTALDGAGAVAWSTSTRGGYQRLGDGNLVVSRTYVEQPYFVGVGQFVPDRAEDVALAVLTEVATPAGAVARLSARVVDGTTGVVSERFSVVSERARLRLSALPDLDRDGSRDLAVHRRTGDETVLEAWSAARAVRLWTSPPLSAASDLDTGFAGDANGDGVPDILLTPVLRDLTSNHSEPTRGVFHLVDGARGTRRWTRAGIRAVPVGDVGQDGRPDVVVLDQAPPDESGVSAVAIDGTGRVRWSVSRALPGLTTAAALPTSRLEPAGEVDGDGVTDLVYLLRSQPLGAAPRTDAGVVSSRTGRVSRTGAAGVPVGVAVDGRGSDLVEAARSGNLLHVVARDGRSGRPLWRTSVSLPAGYRESVETVSGARLDRDPCGDVLVTSTDGETYVTYAFDGASGAPRWTLRRTGPGQSTGTRPQPVQRVDHNHCR
jgi:hypothetical protein